MCVMTSMPSLVTMALVGYRASLDRSVNRLLFPGSLLTTLFHSLTQQLSGTSKLSRLTLPFLTHHAHHLIVNFSEHHHFVTGYNCEYLGEYLEIIFSSSTYSFYVTTFI